MHTENRLPQAEQRTLQTPHGAVIGSSFSWPGGQYCAIHTARGVLGCGIYDIGVANEFDMAFAIAKGTPENPLRVPEDLYDANVVAISDAAARLGITPGMTGLQALEQFLKAETT